jgi:hypothetical protein
MMDDAHAAVDSHRVRTLSEKFHDKRYRDGYVAAHTRGVLARQMRNFRGERSQAEYGAIIGKRQTVVSRLESPAYGSWTLRTMLQIARKENVAVLVRFVDFPTFLSFTDDMSDEALFPQAYDEAEVDRFAAYEERSISYHNFIPPDINIATSMGPHTSVGLAAYPDIFFPGPFTIGAPLGTLGASEFLPQLQNVGNFAGGVWPASNFTIAPLTGAEVVRVPPPPPTALRHAHDEIRRLNSLVQVQAELIANQRRQIEDLQRQLSAIAAAQQPLEATITTFRRPGNLVQNQGTISLRAA